LRALFRSIYRACLLIFVVIPRNLSAERTRMVLETENYNDI
jgi:hypothetical protein